MKLVDMLKKVHCVVFVIITTLLAVPMVRGMPDPFATLVVWPVGTPEGSEGPILTTTPAKLIIYNNDASHILVDLWLMLVINQETYDHLVSISTNTSLTYLAAHFVEIDGTVSPSYKIPRPDAGSETPAYGTYPGMEPDDAYDVGSLRSKLGIPADGSLFYAVADLDSSPGWVDHGPSGLNKNDPEYFTVTVNLSVGAAGWEVLVLALGYVVDSPHTVEGWLNVHSPYTKSTLIVPELPALILALTSFGAFGLYKIRRSKRAHV